MKRRDFRMRYRCAECGRTRDEDKVRRLGIQRLQGGNYRTAPRWGSSSICLECAEDLVDQAAKSEAEGRGRGNMLGMRWSRSQLEDRVAAIRAAEKKDDDDGPEG